MPAIIGQYSKFSVMVANQDVTDCAISLQIFQDIQSPTWSLQIQFVDTSDLLNVIPIIAGTQIQVTIGSDNNTETDGEKTFNFNVYRIGDKSSPNQKVQTYTIYAAPYAFFQNQVTKINQTYQNQKPSDMINNVVTTAFPDFVVDVLDTDNSETITAMNWSPTEAIGFMMKIAHSSNVADYMFFQNGDKEFTCKSIEYLIANNDSLQTLIFQPGNLNQETFEDLGYSYAILKYEWQHFDTMLDLSAGVIKSKMVSLDFLSKTWAEKKYSYGDDNSNDTNGNTLFKDPVFDKAEDAHVTFVAKHTGMNGDNDSVMNSADQWLQSRRASLQKIDQEKLIVQLPGSVLMYQWLGSTINVSLPSQVDGSTQTMDPTRSGKFLVTCVTHWVSGGSYIVNLELVKRRLENTNE